MFSRTQHGLRVGSRGDLRGPDPARVLEERGSTVQLAQARVFPGVGDFPGHNGTAGHPSMGAEFHQEGKVTVEGSWGQMVQGSSILVMCEI